MRRFAWMSVCALSLAACASAPPNFNPATDCGIFGTSGQGQGGYDLFGTGSFLTGGVHVAGRQNCEGVRAFTRSPSGSVVCVGPESWCASMVQAQPITVTPVQLRELMLPE